MNVNNGKPIMEAGSSIPVDIRLLAGL